MEKISLLYYGWIEVTVGLSKVDFNRTTIDYLISLSRYPQVDTIEDINVFYRYSGINSDMILIEVLLTHSSWGGQGIVIADYEAGYTLSFRLNDKELTYFIRSTSDYGHNIFDFCQSLFSKVRKNIEIIDD